MCIKLQYLFGLRKIILENKVKTEPKQMGFFDFADNTAIYKMVYRACSAHTIDDHVIVKCSSRGGAKCTICYWLRWVIQKQMPLKKSSVPKIPRHIIFITKHKLPLIWRPKNPGPTLSTNGPLTLIVSNINPKFVWNQETSIDKVGLVFLIKTRPMHSLNV